MQQPSRTYQPLRRELLTALLLGACAAPAAAAELRLPPIIAPTTSDLLVGKVIFRELVTPDLARARQFYGGLFGWTFGDLESEKFSYAEAMLADRAIGGMFQRSVPAGEHRQSAWLTYFAVRDTDATVQTAVQHGGKVLFAPHDFPDRGRQAVLADPQGAVFAVLASSSGDPPDLLADQGEWIWSSLITPDPDAAAGFYQALFDYDVYPAPNESGPEHLVLASGGYARVSINPPPAARPGMHPHWLNYVRVGDAVATATKAGTLGGRVLVAPRPIQRGGWIALLADPLGAPFGVLEWSNADTTAGAR